jgi:hypothetical protein
VSPPSPARGTDFIQFHQGRSTTGETATALPARNFASLKQENQDRSPETSASVACCKNAGSRRRHRIELGRCRLRLEACYRLLGENARAQQVQWQIDFDLNRGDPHDD